MTAAVPLAEVWRGPILESLHMGHAVICDGSGSIVSSWGDPGAIVYPRSSAKMIQALPLVQSGAADAFKLTSKQLALACASHNGETRHVEAVSAWLADLGLDDDDLMCGPQPSRDPELRTAMVRRGQPVLQGFNNCSGKHAGFLTLAKHLGAPTKGYVELDHPVQKAVFAAFEDVTGEISAGCGLDGCSAPNPACSIQGMARAMAWFATAHTRSDDSSKAAARLVQAMYTHPEMVAGDNRACTDLMRVAREPLAVKTGAEGYFIAILPDRGLGIALKVQDGATRAADCAIAAILSRLGVVDPQDPLVEKYRVAILRNWKKTPIGEVRPASALA
ncbi:MAG: asparaginase [Rhodobacteraceae bacterium]|nr:asparaginase [Paracoccaceae bacterium]